MSDLLPGLPTFEFQNPETPWGGSVWRGLELSGGMSDSWTTEAKLSATTVLRPALDNPTPVWTTSGDLQVREKDFVDIDRYRNLVTWQHRLPKFLGLISAICQPIVEMQNLVLKLDRLYNLDTSVGRELDAIGQWVGVSRTVHPPIGGVYFTWDDEVSTGWDEGIWRGPGDPVTGLVALPDYAYRSIIRGKIVANSWDGTVENAYAAWDVAFNGESQIQIVDYQNMSMTVLLSGIRPDAVYRAIIRDGLLPLKPAGVRVNWKIFDPDAIIFRWDTEKDDDYGSWDESEWFDERLKNIQGG